MSKFKVLPGAILAASLAIALPAEAKDPCATVMCMWGMLQGAGVVDNCADPVADYFNIVERKKGKIKLSRTSNARQSFLDQCEAADSDKTKSINNKFGKVI